MWARPLSPGRVTPLGVLAPWARLKLCGRAQGVNTPKVVQLQHDAATLRLVKRVILPCQSRYYDRNSVLNKGGMIGVGY